MSTPLPTDPIRLRLADLIERQREDMAGLSRMLGRGAGYVRRYLKEGTPRCLPDRERELLARYFRVHEADLLPRTLRDGRAELNRCSSRAAPARPLSPLE